MACWPRPGLLKAARRIRAIAEAAWDRAYQHFVDRLIASPQYGERWARRWLDLARYSDTNGYEKDRPRTIWPYRDWVIRALNDDMPFDRFTIEQIAGDMLPRATQAQRVATGFHRNTMLNEEGGIDPLEYRYYSMVDRVGTTATTWLGLTMMCAQCHTHKYDPITHRDYYRFMALMNNADEPAMDMPTPEITAQRAATAKADRTTHGRIAGKVSGLMAQNSGGQHTDCFRRSWKRLAIRLPRPVAVKPSLAGSQNGSKLAKTRRHNGQCFVPLEARANVPL